MSVRVHKPQQFRRGKVKNVRIVPCKLELRRPDRHIPAARITCRIAEPAVHLQHVGINKHAKQAYHRESGQVTRNGR